ncbi:Helix-turn-helix domain-containing protein [Tenacibaculum sp. MAR_2010_89]|uniref:helix-turn-helix domain-containing protein n=1 Tax=Tenacibaculum sp. MAR_2010_89 TaxID=1250198 RepID=UPI000898B12E|nr:helix-turn-helix domain-containing protein [Tenacibaculum sp. MAR_2010_89]SEE18722.1 Helix-turn-helix domain-containing protein [Tenacibaculum sp. MAR_2010_89]
MTNIIKLHEMQPNELGILIQKIIKEELKQILSLIKNTNEDQVLTRKEAAAFLKISETTLWTLDKTQVLPAKRLNGKVLYFKSDLLNFSS